MARFLLTASGINVLRDYKSIRAAVRTSKRKAEVKISSIRKDEVFANTALIVVSAPTKAGATKVQHAIWDAVNAGACIEIDKLPDRGFGGRRMGAAIPINSYMD